MQAAEQSGRVVLIPIDRESGVSLQEQIFGSIRDRIVSGSLRPGARLPSSRVLADQLSLSRNSVIFAYERLVNEAYAVSRPMIGTFVAETLPDPEVMATCPPTPGSLRLSRTAPAVPGRRHGLLNTATIPIDFWTQRTDPRAFPLKTWRRLILGALAHAGHNLTEYGDPCGLAALRAAIAEHVSHTRGIKARPEQVVIVAGAQLGLNLVLRLLARKGDAIAVENPCNQGAAYLFESFGLAVHPVPVDAEGLQPDALPTAARLAYLTPSHQFPMGPTLSLARRAALVDWADRTGAYLIEDDYDSEFRYDGAPVPALKALAPEAVIYLATFSKSLGAGLRTGFAIVPDHLVRSAEAAKALLDNGQVWLEQAALAEFIASGGFARHLRRVRQQYRLRRDALVTNLTRRFETTTLWGTDAGTHIAWRLPLGLPPASAVAGIARARNIGVYSIQSGGGHEYGKGEHDANWLLLGYASLTSAQIEAGVNRLADAVDVPTRV